LRILTLLFLLRQVKPGLAGAGEFVK